MGFNFKYTKLSAVCQIVLGSLCFVFGIFDRIFIYTRPGHYGHSHGYAFHTEGVLAIWMGAWFIVTGIIGYYASRRPSQPSQGPSLAMVNTYLGFSIVATVFAGVLLICYGVGLSYIARNSCKTYNDCRYSYPTCRYEQRTDTNCQTSVGLGAMIIIFGIVEFGVSIWASICCCAACTNGCCYDTSQPQGQVIYLQTQGGPPAAYVMTQGPNGMPVAVPAMTGGPVYPVPIPAVGGQTYMMQNPQATTTMAPSQYVQGAGGQVQFQNPQGATNVAFSQQGVTTFGDQQPAMKTSESPPAYTT